jgi:two-component system, cell cycle sensor histidine kinase and response regulator CckA
VSPTVFKPSDHCILVAEDDAMQRYVTVRELRRHGYHVLEAGNGAEALWMAGHNEGVKIDLLVTDLRMPVMSGLDLVSELRVSQPDIKVIIVTGELTDDFPPHMAQHVACILEKPVHPKSLIMRVEAALAITNP